MIYDYRDEDGYVSLWVGKCNNYDVLNNYLSTVYTDEDIESQEALKNIFISVNKDRACEEELKNAFDECYNQFKYDFGLSFDEDFRDGRVLEHFTDDLMDFHTMTLLLMRLKLCINDSLNVMPQLRCMILNIAGIF